MVALGDTANDPEVALPVEKFIPVQEVALADDQLNVEDCPPLIELGLAVKLAVTPLTGAMISASCERADSHVSGLLVQLTGPIK